MSLIAELKRRSVFKVSVAYLVVGWLVVQAASIALPAFDAPPNFLRGFILVIALGFPVALVLAWIFDVTPEGVKMDELGIGTKRVFIAAALLAALSVGWFVRGGFGGLFGGHDVVVFEAPLGAQSTAVLPFVNMSSDKENDYFSDGLTETLLHKLAQVPELKVAARTSSFAFKGKQEDIRAIGRELGVATVMEGSVQRAGDTLRITAQLVKTSDGSHIWSRNYDRKLADLFAVQDEIAGAVTEALVGALMPATKAAIAKGGTESIEAYDLYTKAIAKRELASFDTLNEADALLKQALDKDPKYVDAMLALCGTWINMAITGSITLDAERARMEPVLDRIELIDPANPGLLAMRAELAYRRNQPDAGAALFERALLAAPHDAFTLINYARNLDLGKPEQATKAHDLLERAVAIDPLNPQVLYNKAAVLDALKRTDEAMTTAKRLIEIAPTSPIGHQLLGGLEAERGNFADEFLSWRRSQVYDPTDFELAAELAFDLDKLGDRAGADAWLAKSFAIAPGNFYPLAMEVQLAFRRGDLAAVLAKSLPLLPRHDDNRRGNWGLAASEGCLAARALGKRAEFRAALVATRLFPDGLSQAAVKAVLNDKIDAPHMFSHMLQLAPCLVEDGKAGDAQRAELLATVTALSGDAMLKDADGPTVAAGYLGGDRAALVQRLVKDFPKNGDFIRYEAAVKWLGVADDPALIKAFADARAALARESARLPQLLADAKVGATP